MDLETGREKPGVFHISLEPDLKQEEKIEKNFWHIDKEMVRYKLHFFFLTGGLGAIGPFVPAFVQKHLRLSATAYATVIVVMQVFQTLSKPVIGFIVDYFNKLKTVICVLTVCLVLIYFAFFSLPTIPSKTSNNFTSDGINNTFCGQDSCDICEVHEVSKLETDDWIEKNEPFSNLQAENNMNIFSILCGNDLNYLTYNLSYFSSSCFYNGSVFKLKDHRLPDMYENNRILLNVSTSWCSTCLNETNTCSLYIPECILCCNNVYSCYMSSNDISEASSSEIEPEKYVSSDFNSHQFWLFVPIFVSIYICIGNLFILSDTACCESVQKSGADYGRQRLFGPIGWGLLSLVGGLLSDYTQSYMAACSLLAVMLVAMLWNISKMDFEKPNHSTTFFKDVGNNFLSKEFIAFEIGALVNGIGMGAIWYYLIWFLITIGGTNFLFGLVHAFQNIIGELPFMFFSGWMIQKMGHFHITTLSLLSYCIRFFYLAYLQNPWYVLLIEWTHGIYYGVYYVAVASFAKLSAKPGTEATMQSILFMTFDGFGTAIGNIMTGVSIDYFGAHQTFYYGGIFFGLSSVMSFIFSQFHRDTVNICRRTSKTCVVNK